MSRNYSAQANESPSDVTTATELGAMHRDPETGEFVAAYRDGDPADKYD